MEHIIRKLSEAHCFLQEGRKDAAYYKHIDTALLTMELVASQDLFELGKGLPPDQVEKLFKLIKGSLERAAKELYYVLDFNDERADRVQSEGILELTGPYERTNEAALQRGVDFEIPEPYKKVILSEELVKKKEEENKDDYEYFGPEPSLSLRSGPLPMIPMSYVALNQCQTIFELQLLIQKFEPFANATAKQRSNAEYLTGLLEIFEQIRGLSNTKVQWEEAVKLSGNLRVRDIPPLEMARQITLLQMDSFKMISIEELRLPENGNFLTANLDAFNSLGKYLTHWCQYEILRYSRSEDRASVIGYMTRVMNHLSDLGNYDGLYALVSGITSEPIQRLNETHALLPKKINFCLNSHTLLASPRRNYAQLRDAINRRACPCIPYLGLYRRSPQDPNKLEEALKQLQEFKNSDYRKTNRDQPVVQHYILTQPFRWEEELYAISMLREPSGKEVKKVSGTVEMSGALTAEELGRIDDANSGLYDEIRRNIQSHSQGATNLPRHTARQNGSNEFSLR